MYAHIFICQSAVRRKAEVKKGPTTKIKKIFQYKNTTKTKSIGLRVKHFSSSMIRSLPSSSSKFCIHVTYIQRLK